MNRIPVEARIWLVRTPAHGARSAAVPAAGSGGVPPRENTRRETLHEPAGADARATDPIIVPPEEVREKFKRVKPLEEIPVEKRGWMLDMLNIVRQSGKSEFTNQDVYAFESRFKQLHPDNHFIRDKIRQQLQDLARTGFLIHAGRNDWRLK